MSLRDDLKAEYKSFKKVEKDATYEEGRMEDERRKAEKAAMYEEDRMEGEKIKAEKAAMYEYEEEK